jgi:RNA polymerase sigma-70 factor (ECF subfamily)
MEKSDTELLDSLERGDDSAIEELLRRYQSRIYKFAMQMCGDPEHAKDVAQETLLAMAQSLGSFRRASSISTWAYTIARSFCIKNRRKSKFAPAEELSLDGTRSRYLEPVSDPSHEPDRAVSAKELETFLNQAIQSLDPMYREVLLLRDAEELSASEVAEVLGIGTEAVKSRLHRARLMVRERIAPLLGLPVTSRAPASPGCPEVLMSFSRHLEGEIDRDTCKSLEDHVAHCSYCRKACDSLKRTLALCRDSSNISVPADVQESVRTAIRVFLSSKS